MLKKKVLVMFGGLSMEYYAACKAVGNLIDYIDGDKFDVKKIGITRDGRWLLTEATSDEIRDGDLWAQREDNKEAIITPVRNDYNILILEDGKYEKLPIDIVFPLVVGYAGEDGKLSGLLEMLNIPYIGSGVAASACGMDKSLTKLFANDCNLKQPQSAVITKTEYENVSFSVDDFVKFEYPVFVKPASGGTSVGITRALSSKDMDVSLKEAFKYDNKVILEEQIVGSEIKVAVLGNDELEFGAICELEVDEGKINDYETKQNSISKKTIPANLDDALVAKIKEQSRLIYKSLGCSSFARIDFFLTKDKELYFNEINTVPGLGKKSIYSLMFEAAGVTFKDLLTKLILTADKDK